MKIQTMWKWIEEQAATQPLFAYKLALVLVLAVVVIPLKIFDAAQFWRNFWNAAYGMPFDILVLGWFVTWVHNKGEDRRAKAQRIKRYQEEIDDYRGWDGKEALHRNMGVIRRLSREGATDMDLRGTYLWGVDLMDVDLREASVTGTILVRARLIGAKFEKAKFMGTNLKYADLTRAYLSGAHFLGANLQRAILFNADLRDASFGHTVLHSANLRSTDLRNAYFFEADLYSADLRDANLEGADLRGANLENVIYNGSTRWPDGTKLPSSVKRIGKFSTLRGADLRKVDLKWADLYGADLEGADLRGADLSFSDLREADLEGVDLRGADLIKADLKGAYLEHIVYDDGTKWSYGFTPPPDARTVFLEELLTQDLPMEDDL